VADLIKGKKAVGAKAFGEDKFINQIIAQDCPLIIPLRSNRKAQKEGVFFIQRKTSY